MIQVFFGNAVAGSCLPDALSVLPELEGEQGNQPYPSVELEDLTHERWRIGSCQLPVQEDHVVYIRLNPRRELFARVHVINMAYIDRNQQEGFLQEGEHEIPSILVRYSNE